MKHRDPLQVMPFVYGRLLNEARKGNVTLADIDWSVDHNGFEHRMCPDKCADLFAMVIETLRADGRKYLAGKGGPQGACWQILIEIGVVEMGRCISGTALYGPGESPGVWVRTENSPAANAAEILDALGESGVAR